MQIIFYFNESVYDFMVDYRMNFSVLTAATTVVSVVVMLTEYLHADAQNSQRPVCQFCEGNMTISVVRKSHRNDITMYCLILFYFAQLMIIMICLCVCWLMVLFKLKQVATLSYIFWRECQSQLTIDKFKGDNTGCMDFSSFSKCF